MKPPILPANLITDAPMIVQLDERAIVALEGIHGSLFWLCVWVVICSIILMMKVK